jgi:hypothetical protein
MYGSPGATSHAQYPIGILTWFRPTAAICSKSSRVIKESQCVRRAEVATERSWFAVKVHSSTMEGSRGSKSQGVMNGSVEGHGS